MGKRPVMISTVVRGAQEDSATGKPTAVSPMNFSGVEVLKRPIAAASQPTGAPLPQRIQTRPRAAGKHDKFTWAQHQARHSLYAGSAV
ncbi:hypothetical protein ACTI_79910 [Actinoplanes sp. OR16]|nr:hypothetical protein ACTI_79910 [Actinoplanes sp. OR16]